MHKLLSAEAVAASIKDRATITFPGNLSVMVADHLLEALERRFLSEGHPRDLTIFEPCNGAIGEGTGVERFGHAGLTKRIVCSAFPTFKDTRITAMIRDDVIEGYNFPMGVLYSLAREIGAGRPGVVTKVGMGTFVDPERGGGKLNGLCRDDLVERVRLGGEEYLFYKAFPIDVALLKATTADELGNLSLEREPLSLGVLSLAIAAKASGGRVFAQVERRVAGNSLHPRAVAVPGALVDGVVLAPDAAQTGLSRHDPTITGELRVELSRSVLPPGPERLILGRAATELREGWLINLGVGIPNALPRLLHEAGCEHLVTVSTEHGAIGGLPQAPPAFGTHVNVATIIDPTDSFNLYTGGVLDAAFLGMAQADAAGDVNVTKFGGRIMGVGGFVDIVSRTPRIVICGTLTAGGAVVAVADGRVRIEKEGSIRKLVPKVEQATLNGMQALSQGQSVRMITERGTFELTLDGWELVEIAPGIDPQRDIAAMVAFPLRISSSLRTWPFNILTATGAQLGAWLRPCIASGGERSR